ncbi:hypothetical protein [Cognatilysobacter lacus]|nr:hypothetical protein [Lysobacter lacus]
MTTTEMASYYGLMFAIVLVPLGSGIAAWAARRCIRRGSRMS